jgi:hypothetical protein
MINKINVCKAFREGLRNGDYIVVFIIPRERTPPKGEAFQAHLTTIA